MAGEARDRNRLVVARREENVVRSGRNRWVKWVIAPALLVGLTSGSTVAAAQEASPAAGPPGPPAGCEIVADGLMSPRQLAIATDGTLYVTEAGTGGDEVLDIGAPGEEEDAAVASPAADAEPEGPPVTRGTTGQVTSVNQAGEQLVVASGLPSYSFGVGPVGIALGDGVIYVAIGGIYAPDLEPLPNENAVVAIDMASGEVTTVAELGSFEVENNPDGTDVNPNLYGMDLGADGALYVADAGGNTVYRVDPATGEVALLGVVPSPEFPALAAPASPESGTPPAEESEALHPVPTGVDAAADGNVYVGLLGPFVPGTGGVVIAQADGTFVDAATGLITVIGVALGPDGALYASQFTAGGEEGEELGPGNVVRVGADGAAEVVIDGLVTPNGIAFDDTGNLYVVVNSAVFGPPGPPAGQVLRCDGVAAGTDVAAPSDAVATPVT